MKKKKPKSIAATFKLIGIFFAIFGISFLISGCIAFSESTLFMKDAVKTEAEIVRIETDRYRRNGENQTSHDVWVEYTVDGEVFEGKLNEYNSGMYEGKEIEVYYDIENPSDVRTASKLVYIIFLGIGVVFAILGTIFIILSFKLSNRRKKLMQNGDKLSGTITNVSMSTNIYINHRHPYKAECEVINPYDSEKYLYSSENVIEDITGFVGMEVTVYVDRNDKSKYYVDIFELIERYDRENKIHDYR